jgi:hypothetical protein
LKVYSQYVDVFIDGVIVNKNNDLVLKDGAYDKEEICNNWNELNDFYIKYGGYMPFSMHESTNTKNEKIIVCFFDSDKQLRSDKDTMPEIKISMKYIETSCTFGELLQFDADDVVRFISERIRR